MPGERPDAAEIELAMEGGRRSCGHWVWLLGISPWM
jgi:hypothetical protein